MQGLRDIETEKKEEIIGIYHGVGSRTSGLNRSFATRTVLQGPPVLEILLAEMALAQLGSLYEGPATPRGSCESVVNVPQG